MPKGHRALTACRLLVSGTFHSPSGVLFTFPSRYWFTIGRQRVFSLTRWSSQIPTGFHVSRSNRVTCPGRTIAFHVQDSHLLWSAFPHGSAMLGLCNFPAILQYGQTGPSTPHAQRLQPVTRTRFWLFPFRSPLLRKSRLLSFPRGTEMVHFPRYRLPCLFYSTRNAAVLPQRVAPFGNPRIKAC